jgi:hypothetical protein
MPYGYGVRRRRRSYGVRRLSGRARYSRRRSPRRRARRSRQQRIVIQVVGGPGSAAPVSAVTLGKKSARVLRRRY